MTGRRWRPPPHVGADPVAAWMCNAARDLVPLGAREHTAVHAVANVLADDVVVNGRPPLDLEVEATDEGISISVTDGRDCDARRARPLPRTIEEIRPLTSAITMHHPPGRPGCTLTAAIPLRRGRTLRSRLAPWRRGRP